MYQSEVELFQMFESVESESKRSFLDLVNHPRASAGVTSAIVTEEHKISRCKREFMPTHLESILRIVQEFGMGLLETDSPMPEAFVLSNPVLGN